MTDVPICIRTGKRMYESLKQARQANQKNSHRIRPYICPECGMWHVAKGEQQ